MIKKQCTNCSQIFQITDEDLIFYKKISPQINGQRFLVPTPTLCPDCRQMRRLAFRNEHFLYSRKCDLCGKQMISIYHPNTDLKVYCYNCWWSDIMVPENRTVV